MNDLQTNVLYYGDNLDILRRYVPDASIDLIYLSGATERRAVDRCWGAR